MQKAHRDALIQILLWNIAPYWGVLCWGWDPLTVALCYVLESWVIGGFNLFKLIAVSNFGKPPEKDSVVGNAGIFSVFMFITSYGLILLIEYYALFQALGFFEMYEALQSTDNMGQPADPFTAILLLIKDDELLLLMTGFVVLNAYAFITEFILNGKYTRLTIEQQFTEPFPRLMVTFALITIGGLIYVNSGSKISVLVALTVFKIVTELVMWRKTVKQEAILT